MIKHVINYAIIQLLSKILPIAGVFVFSLFLTPEELGYLSLHLATIWILATFLSANLHSGIGRLLYTPDIDNGEILGTALLAIFATTMVTCFAWIALLDFFAELVHLPKEVLILQVPIAIGLTAESILTQFSIYQQNSRRLVAIVALKSALFISLACIGISLNESDKFIPIIYADFVAATFMIVTTLCIISPRAAKRFSRKIIRTLASYSLPLIFYTLSIAALSQLDRIFLANLTSITQVGVYNLSYSIGGLTLMVAIPVMNAFQPRFFQTMYSDDADLMMLTAKLLTLALLIPTVFVAFLMPSIAKSIYPESYAQGLIIIPIVAIGAMGQIFFLIWSRVLVFHHRTVVISMIALGALLINCALNLILIPVMGILGAAIATMLAQFSMMTALHFVLYFLDYPRQLFDTDLVVIPLCALVWLCVTIQFPSTSGILAQFCAMIIISGTILWRMIQLIKNRKLL